MTEQGSPLFYGWFIVAGLAVVGMVSVGLGGVNFGLFIPAIQQTLEINHSYFGLAQTARLLGYAATSWLVGRILDRYGARFPMAAAGALLGLVMIGLSRMQAGWQLVMLFFLIGAIGMEGAGGNLYQSVPVSRWFVRKRGKAMSLSFLGSTLGMLIFSPIIQFLIFSTGWRYTWIILGGSSSIIIVIVALAIVRKDPQSMGLQPDGYTTPDIAWHNPDPSRDNPPSEYHWTRFQALRHPAFWVVATVLGLRMFSMTTISIFRIPFFIEQGLSPLLVAWSISFEAVVAALTAVAAGWAVDRLQPRPVMVSSLIVFIAVFFVVLNVRAVWQLFLAAGLFGASVGSFAVAQNVIWPNYFGALHIGSIRGAALPWTMVFSAFGGPLAGLIKDVTGAYTPAWIIAMASLTIATALLLFVRKPNPTAAT